MKPFRVESWTGIISSWFFPLLFSKDEWREKRNKKNDEKIDSGCQWCMSESYNLRPVTHINSSTNNERVRLRISWPNWCWKIGHTSTAEFQAEFVFFLCFRRIKGCICGCFTVKINNVLHFRGEAIILLFLTRFHPFLRKIDFLVDFVQTLDRNY